MDVIALLKLLVEQVLPWPNFECNQCGLAFSNVMTLRRHENRVSGNSDIQKADGGKVWALPFQLTADVGLPGSLAPAHQQSHLGGGSVKNAETCHLSFDQTNQNKIGQKRLICNSSPLINFFWYLIVEFYINVFWLHFRTLPWFTRGEGDHLKVILGPICRWPTTAPATPAAQTIWTKHLNSAHLLSSIYIFSVTSRSSYVWDSS